MWLRKADTPRAREALSIQSQLFFTASREQRVCMPGRRRALVQASRRLHLHVRICINISQKFRRHVTVSQDCRVMTTQGACINHGGYSQPVLLGLRKAGRPRAREALPSTEGR